MRINRLKKVIKVFLIILAILLIIVIAIVGCALITYHKQPVLTEEDKEELSVDNIWKTRTEPEMAEVIEDNGDALLERIKLIATLGMRLYYQPLISGQMIVESLFLVRF